MTSKIVIGAIVAIAFLAGTITTATLAEAVPDKDADGDGIMEGIVHEIIGVLNHATHELETIQNAITSVQTDITMIKSDVGDIKIETDKIPMIKSDVIDIKAETDKITEINSDIADIKFQTDKIPMIKSDVFNVKTQTDKIQMLKDQITSMQTQIDNLPEHLTSFVHFSISEVAEDFEIEVKIIRYVSTDGPMIMEVCKGAGEFGEGSVSLLHVEEGVFFVMDEDEVPECRTMGAEAGEHISVRLQADAGLIDTATVRADITIRTTPGSVILFADVT